MSNPPLKNAPHQLLVEGPDDMHTVIQFMKRQGYDWEDATFSPPFIRNCKGVEGLLDLLKLILKNPSYTRVGIILDADENLESTWQSVRDRLLAIPNAKLSPPEDLPDTGYVEATTDASHPRYVGVWIMPDNQNSGKLEDFLSAMIPPEDQCWPYCDEVLQEARIRGAPFEEKDHSKAKMHTWLAWQKKPGNPFGQAFMAKDFNADGELAKRFYQWFTMLFSTSAVPRDAPG